MKYTLIVNSENSVDLRILNTERFKDTFEYIKFTSISEALDEIRLREKKRNE